MAEDGTSYREDVEQLRRRFAEFRQTHAARSRLPEELWGEAAQLARRDGIPATARALRVERPSLRKWTDRFQPRSSTKLRKSWRRQRPGGSGAPAFVELLAASGGAATSCLVEVESQQGSKLRLELKGMAISQLVELMRAFAGS
jgi:hypothetical protein